MYKRLLVISHNCFSQAGSNGRTMANLLFGWPKDKVAQLYIHKELPDYTVSDNYFCITDKDVLNSILKRCQAGKSFEAPSDVDVSQVRSLPQKKPSSKNSIIFLLREFAWSSGLWRNEKLYEWIDGFSPEIVLVQAGDAAFLFKLAEKICKRFNSSLFVFNTEGYYFKKKSYLNETVVSRLFYPIVHKNFVKAYDSLISKAKAVVYSNDTLMRDYFDSQHKISRVIMTSSEFADEDLYENKINRFVYAGNLGLMRHKGLIEFAEALNSIDKNLVVDVYGTAPTKSVDLELSACSSIVMHGFVHYKDLLDILRKSRFLIHVESFDPFYCDDLKYAFSTKVADSLACGACFIVYAPENMAVSQYLKDKKAAVLINKRDELYQKLRNVLFDDKYVEMISRNGRALAMKNHSLHQNREAFQKLLLS